MIPIKLQNTIINIDIGNYTDDVEKARKAIQAEVDKHTVIYESERDWGTLTINDQTHNITPYGIDIAMMFRFFNIMPSDVNQPPAQQSNAAPTFFAAPGGAPVSSQPQEQSGPKTN